MTEKHTHLFQRLQKLGFTKGTQMKLYGEMYDFTGEPIIVTDDVAVIDAEEKNTGQVRRVRIPLHVVRTAIGSNLAA